MNGGPLPERTLRALAVALAEALAVLHGQNLSHAGVCPAAAAARCRRAPARLFRGGAGAAPDGVPRWGAPGLDAGSLPPEQAAGGQPRPLGDVYALGATVAYAATGRRRPRSAGVAGRAALAGGAVFGA
ncbi:hypothetical protein ACRAWF_43930 [Streptomyces sp. L7]